MSTIRSHCSFAATLAGLFFAVAASTAWATHSWNGYHWARTSTSFSLKLGDNLSSNWDAYLGQASADWSSSDVLDTSVVTGRANSRNCRPTAGRVEVCNATYGNNGWLGVASIWISGGVHITQGTVKVNDTYFNSATYNNPAWRQMVLCQEIGHTFGLDHQDTNFNNSNLGTCMDYTSNPSGPPDNEHPNTHDYDELDIIYSHLDSSSTLAQGAVAAGANIDADIDTNDPSNWGPLVKRGASGHTAIYERDLGAGRRLVTFVIYAVDSRGNRSH